MADTILSYTIPEGKKAEYIAAYVFVHKNTETIPDPEWVDPEDGSEAPQVAKYSDGAWVREHIKRSIRKQIVRGMNAQAKAAITAVNADDVV